MQHTACFRGPIEASSVSTSNIFTQKLSAAKLDYFFLKLIKHAEKFCVALKCFCSVSFSVCFKKNLFYKSSFFELE